MRISPLFLLAPLAASTAIGCHRTAEVDTDSLHFLQVEVLDGPGGSEAEPLAFTTDAAAVSLRVQALNRNAEPLAIGGSLDVKLRPGEIAGDDEIELVDGLWEGEISISKGFGPTRIWFSDEEGEREEDVQLRAPSYVTGVSDAFWYQLPTIAELQTTDDHETNPLEGEFTEVRVEDRNVVVVAIGIDGMWVTDLDDEPGDYNGLFIYSYNKPEYSSPEGEYADELIDVVPGMRLAMLGGGNQEYLASTQLSFPTYEFASDEPATLPDAVDLGGDMACEDDPMEKLESSLVRAENVTIPDFDYAEGSDFYEYGQWPVTLGDCTLYAESAASVPGFAPSDYIGSTLDLQGMLKEVWGKWVIIPRDEDDISIASDSARPSALRGRNPARMRR